MLDAVGPLVVATDDDERHPLGDELLDDRSVAAELKHGDARHAVAELRGLKGIACDFECHRGRSREAVAGAADIHRPFDALRRRPSRAA